MFAHSALPCDLPGLSAAVHVLCSLLGLCPKSRLLGPKQWEFLLIPITSGHIPAPLMTHESSLLPTPLAPKHILFHFHWSGGCTLVLPGDFIVNLALA